MREFTQICEDNGRVRRGGAGSLSKTVPHFNSGAAWPGGLRWRYGPAQVRRARYGAGDAVRAMRRGNGAVGPTAGGPDRRVAWSGRLRRGWLARRATFDIWSLRS